MIRKAHVDTQMVSEGWGEEEVAKSPLDGFKDHGTRKTHVDSYTLLLSCGAGEDS